ncbi:MAG: ribose-phosphate pyrophosphokinase [Gammaproteobacteria bacterium AqS3]|nr:ribose-phosphate pyrophosphokinase [Gammaproteobacteria bacterium AqS3]
MLFSGRALPDCAEAIAKHLGIPLAPAQVEDFRDGEISVEIKCNVRGFDVFILQSTCRPTHRRLMELLLMVDALRRSAPARITVVMPYFGYSRQDRRVRSARVPISAKVVADMLGQVGVDRVVTIDLHSDQIQGFFNMPVENIYATPVLLRDIQASNYPDPVIVSPDVGGVVRARALAKALNDLDLAIMDKRRPRANEAEVLNVIGSVEGKTCIMVDDIVDTAGTLCAAADVLKKSGAQSIIAYCTHAVLSSPAVENISKSQLDQLVVTDTIPLRQSARDCEKIRTLSLAETLAEVIRRISNEESISALFL